MSRYGLGPFPANECGCPGDLVAGEDVAAPR
jgi:hypothetical protein